MRDAFGGAFMIRLFLVFIFIYVAFTAIALNYAKAFKVKNSIIDFIETNEITNLESYLATGTGANASVFDKILDDANYTVSCNSNSGSLSVSTENGFCYRGVLIERISNNSQSNKYTYYKVTTAVEWKLGVLNLILTFGSTADSKDPLGGSWKISGETRIVNHQAF